MVTGDVAGINAAVAEGAKINAREAIHRDVLRSNPGSLATNSIPVADIHAAAGSIALMLKGAFHLMKGKVVTWQRGDESHVSESP